jgi:hypothetical protein
LEAHPTLTLTGMYNVLEKLRRAEPLNSKDKAIHEHGLVSVLQNLHDSLDEAVLSAYGWSDLKFGLTAHSQTGTRLAAVEALLGRLVALNAKRAAEEAAGTVRWLRPAFQAAASAPEQAVIDTPDQASDPAAAATLPPVDKRPWPAGLPEQIKAVSDVMQAARRPLTLDDLAAHFTARGRWRDRLPTIVETLEAIGRARRTDKAESPAWATA